jgi:hypothetical protein
MATTQLNGGATRALHIADQIITNSAMSTASLVTSLLQYVPDQLVPTVDSLSRNVLGRLPSTQEQGIIRELQILIATSYNDRDHEPLLQRMFDASGVESLFGIPYARTGEHWQWIGFQGCDPATDVRGGGQLGLECVVFFLERHALIARAMQESRATDRSAGENYPWVSAGIGLTRALAAAFDVLTPHGAPMREFTRKTHWHLLHSVEDFERLFCCLFVLLDRVWQEEHATYMDYPRVMKIAQQRLANILSRAPASVADVERVVDARMCPETEYSVLPILEDELDAADMSRCALVDDLIDMSYSEEPKTPKDTYKFWLDTTDEPPQFNNKAHETLRLRTTAIAL